MMMKSREAIEERALPLTAEARAALRAMADGDGRYLLNMAEQLLAIPPGGTTSYAELGRRLGRPQAARAVGAAVGRNPISIVVPCHRVLGTGGALTGYAGGLERKTALLRLEGVLRN